MSALCLWTFLTFASVPGVRFVASGQLPVVSVTVQGTHRVDMLLDTGSTRSVLDTSLAAELDLRPLLPSPVATPQGEILAERVVLDTVALGNLERGPLTVFTADLEALRGLDGHLDGILGLDFLSTFHYLIDYRAGTFDIEPPSRPLDVGGTRLRYRPGESLILLPTDRDIWMALDTGAQGLVFPESAGLAVAPDGGARLQSAGGVETVRTGSVRRLSIGPIVLRDVSVTLLPTSALPHGLLPAHVFGRLYVNHPEGFVVLDPP